MNFKLSYKTTENVMKIDRKLKNESKKNSKILDMQNFPTCTVSLTNMSKLKEPPQESSSPWKKKPFSARTSPRMKQKTENSEANGGKQKGATLQLI